MKWDPATDPPNPADHIAYRAYRSSTPGGEDFTRARRCGTPVPDAGPVEEASLPCYVTTGAGATSVVVRDVLPARDFYYVVRAVDAAGNEDKNTVEVSGMTLDETPPEFGGVRSVAVLTAHSIKVSWGAGFDLGTPDSLLTFDVFVSEGAAPDPTKDKPTYTSKPGERSTTIKDLKASTSYKVMVRAVDGAAHSDGNKRVLGVTTPEGVAPTFDGVRRANAEGSSIRLFWSPATDNLTSPPSIVYDVYESLRQRGEDLTGPPKVTSAPGASSILMANLESGTRYYYVVKARDFAGNRDEKPPPSQQKPLEIEVSAITAVPDTAPPTFTGAQLVTGGSPTSVQVTWSTANDDRSLLARDFTYFIYASTASPVPLTAPALTVRGVTSATLAGLLPDTSYNVVVVAQDAAGNKSTSVVTQSGKTLAAIPGDTTPPVLAANPTAAFVVSTPTRLNVSWSAATDDTYAATDIRYHVCASTVQAECQGSRFTQHVLATTNYDVTTAALNFLASHTPYFVFVRAEDRAGNLETADHFVTATTATSWSGDVRRILFNRCIACHNFDQPSAIVNVGASYTDATNKACTPPIGLDGCQLKLVDQGRPEFSYLYRKVNPEGLQTPPFTLATNEYSGLREPRDTTEPITVGEDEILLSWITQGALGN